MFWKHKFATQYTCLSFSCNLIGNFKQTLKSNLLFCFKGSFLIGWEKDVIWKKWSDS